VHDTAEISKWFDALWEKSGRIEDPHLALAKDAWKLRQRAKPSLQSIADLDVEKGKTPLLYWLGDSDWEYNKKSIKEYFGNVTKGNLSLIDDGLEAETPLDAVAMNPGTWVVVWEPKTNGDPKRTPKPYWFYTGRLVPKSFRYVGETRSRDTVIPADLRPSVPFDLNAPHVLDAFIETLSSDQYKELRTLEYKGAWFTADRLRLMNMFWRSCKDRYLQLTEMHPVAE